MGFEIINSLKKEKGLTNAQIAKMSGITLSTLDKITSGVNTNPKLDTLQAICKVLGCTLDDFSDQPKKAPPISGEAMKLADDYEHQMDDRGRETVRGVADLEVARYKAALQKQRKQDEVAEEIAPEVVFICPGFSSPMSAGTGQQAGEEYPENYRLIKEPPRGTSYIAPIDGNSMEPTYQDGEKLFIHACTHIRKGQIGVFFMDGKQWVKEMGDDVLISHNPKYEPLKMTEDIVCQGLVLGVCDESYFE